MTCWSICFYIACDSYCVISYIWIWTCYPSGGSFLKCYKRCWLTQLFRGYWDLVHYITTVTEQRSASNCKVTNSVGWRSIPNCIYLVSDRAWYYGKSIIWTYTRANNIKLERYCLYPIRSSLQWTCLGYQISTNLWIVFCSPTCTSIGIWKRNKWC